MAQDIPTAINELQTLVELARQHKRAAGYHRRKAREAAVARDELFARLQALGVTVELLSVDGGNRHG